MQHQTVHLDALQGPKRLAILLIWPRGSMNLPQCDAQRWIVSDVLITPMALGLTEEAAGAHVSGHQTAARNTLAARFVL